MRRIRTIVASFGAALLLCVAGASWLYGPDATAAGRVLYDHRLQLHTRLAAPREDGPLVVWMGDSTILMPPTYPPLVARADGQRVHHRVVAHVGLDFFHYYFLMGPVLDLRPDVVVLVANLRMFGSQASSWIFNDLASLVPASQMTTTLRLPLHARGLTIPGFLIMQTLRVEAGEQALYFLEGLRKLFHDGRAWELIGPRADRRPLDQRLHGVMAGVRGVFAAYDVPLGSRQATVHMMAATVRMAVGRGAHVLVIASPIPWEKLTAEGHYDAAVVDARIGVLRRTVETNGGEFLDEHGALAQSEFGDASGHYNDAGARHMAELVAPTLARALGACAQVRSHERAPQVTRRLP